VSTRRLLVRSASRLFPLVLVCACTPPASRAIARLTAESEVRLAQRQRFEAMMKQDVTALDTLLDDELDYVHTAGNLQSRSQFIDMIKTQKLVYESIAPSVVRVRVYDGLALATGRSQMRVRNAAGVSSFGIRFTEVYVRRGGQWLLTAWEATRLPAYSAGERSRPAQASTKPKQGALSFAANRLELLYRRRAR
jgi:Domain of unknown function (DUF4440)